MAETIFKLAGGKKYNTTGTEENAIKTFTEFCTNKGIIWHSQGTEHYQKDYMI